MKDNKLSVYTEDPQTLLTEVKGGTGNWEIFPMYLFPKEYKPFLPRSRWGKGNSQASFTYRAFFPNNESFVC